MKDTIVRPMRPEEIDSAASLIASGYYGDIFFKWVVYKDEDHHRVVTNYYKAYLNARRCMAYVAEDADGKMVGASAWLPHDTDASVYNDIDAAVGIYADRFRTVADWSHLSEPPMTPFCQLVGFATMKEAQGRGVGAAMLKYHLDIMDEAGIATYLEASTPYFGKGVYGKFGYQLVGELMVFTDTAVLYPLWRPARKKLQVDFGGYKWRILEEHNDNVLLLSENIIEHGRYHNTFENVTWETSDVRKYLNDSLYGRFTLEEQSRILETEVVIGDNPWNFTNGGKSTIDKVFLLSIEEMVKYFGDSGQLKNPSAMFFVDDGFNDARKATFVDGMSARWFLRTPGNHQNFVSVVTIEGKISVTGDFVNRVSTELFNVGIRPAMWVKKGGLLI